MSLAEILNTRLKSLYKELKKTKKILDSNKDKLRVTTDNIDLLNLFLEDMVNIENLRVTDTEFITDLLVEYKFIKDYKIEDDLKVIKLLLKGIVDNNLKISLSKEQKSLVQTYVENVNKLIDNLKEKKANLTENVKSIQEDYDSIEEDILAIEILVEKITDVEDTNFLDKEDLEIIREICEDKSVDLNTRKELLIKFIEYNNDRKENKSKVNKADINEVIACFSEFNINMISTIKKYSTEVETYAKINNIREILEYMNGAGILRKFNNSDLLAICLHGNVESVMDAYENVVKKSDYKFYYAIPSVWINNVQVRKTKKKKYRGQEQKEKTKTSLNQIAHLISKEEIESNIEYLTKEGFTFDQNDPGFRKAITTSNYRLKEAVEALKLYGLIDATNVSEFKVWLLAESQIVEKLDRFVELGLLNGHDVYPDYVNYLKKYPSKLHNIEYSVYLLLYNAKQTTPSEVYYTSIASNKRGQLAGNLNSGAFCDILDSPESIEEFKYEHFVRYEDYIENYSVYEDIIDSNFDTSIDDKIFKKPEIINLEDNFRVEGNPYVYVFDGVVISRMKVLRNYSLVGNGNVESLMSSIVKGSFLTKESFEKIAKSINYSLGGNNGLLKKV